MARVSAAVADMLDFRLASLAFAGLLLGLLFDAGVVLIYLLSYAFHLLNIETFVRRRTTLERFSRQTFVLRLLAVGTLAVAFAPYVTTPLNLWAAAPIAAGLWLQFAAVRALGWDRTYYGVELGAVAPRRIQNFPYNGVPHPMHLGIMLQLAGLYALSPAFTQAYPYLIPGHMALTVLTALVEHLDLHFQQRFFPVRLGRFRGTDERGAVDRLREWFLQDFSGFVGRESSLHRYVKTLPDSAVALIDRLRYSPEVLAGIKAAYPGSRVVALPMTDEIYLSRYNYDRGGDQGLFDVHYDGNLRSLPGMTVVRALIYLSSDDHLEVVFDSSRQRANFKTYDFGLLDFHRERHWVEGSYQETNPPRILLKCNYYVDHGATALGRRLGIGLNIGVFYVVKAAMEYSKSPRTVPQRIVGFFCNVFRRLNNISPALPVALIVLMVALVSGGLLAMPLPAGS